MSERTGRLGRDSAEALAVFTAEPSPGEPLCMEYTSRGDRVPASLWKPLGTAASARLVVLLASEDAPSASGSAAELAKGGAFVFAPDLPLCGRRESPKLSAQLAQSGPGDLRPAERDRLIEAAHDQAVADVQRGLDVLAELHPETLEGAPGELIATGSFAASVAASLAEVEPLLTIRAGG